jgi:hypothetical protein
MRHHADDVHVPLTISENNRVTEFGKRRLRRCDWQMLGVVLVGAVVFAACMLCVVRLRAKAPALPQSYTRPS